MEKVINGFKSSQLEPAKLKRPGLRGGLAEPCDVFYVTCRLVKKLAEPVELARAAKSNAPNIMLTYQARIQGGALGARAPRVGGEEKK